MSAVPPSTPPESGIAAPALLRRVSRRVRGLAIAGVAVLVLGRVVLATGLLGGSVFGGVDENPDKRVSGAGDRSVANLAVGACFTNSRRGEVYSAIRVACSRAHDGEVFAMVSLTGPGGTDDALGKQSYHQCRNRLTDYVMDDWSMSHSTGVNYFYPARELRQSGSTTAVCFTADTHGRTTGSVRKDATNLPADQIAFLRLELASGRVWRTQPDTGSMTANHAWSAKLATTLDGEADSLEAADWPVGARPKVAAYVAELRKSAELWRTAEAARDSDNYFARSDDAWGHPDYTYQRDARKALGLASDLPATSFGPPF
ncbi:hypothetical protein [Peterkaempfera sp. SMS 1(5)a]|uniref:hypothetical protein n=1 Tax=Peterkaempfera podocarpi TaxID=3232308 RepID=UPI00366D94A0